MNGLRVNRQLVELDRVFGFRRDGAESFNSALASLCLRHRELTLAFNRVGPSLAARDSLIGVHCDIDRVSTFLHEEYHDVSDRLLADVLASFSGMKTFCNALALFIKVAFPHASTRGLRFKSFGSLVESAVKTVEGSHGGDLRSLLRASGVEVDAFLAFRDKHIEHPGTLTERSLVAGDDVRITVRTSQSSWGRRPARGDLEPLFVNKIRFEPRDGRAALHYFHVRSNSEIGSVRMGAPVGVTQEADAHFGRRGSHLHVFGKPELDPDVLWRAVPHTEDEVNSPDVRVAMSSISALTIAVVDLANRGHQP